MGWDGIHSLSGFRLSRDISLAPQVTPPYVKGRPRIVLFQRNIPLYGLPWQASQSSRNG